MDARTQKSPGVPLILLGSDWVGPRGLKWDERPQSADAVFDVAPLLRDQKSIKLMAKQDRMALVAAAGALKRAGLSATQLRERTGVYAGIGALAFDQEELQRLADFCMLDGGDDAFWSASCVYPPMNPMMTFKCLPNMAVFQISYHLGLNGPYFITYPGTGQWLAALLRAWHDLAEGLVDFALVGSVAEQSNSLVRCHFDRLYGTERPIAIDNAAFWVLTCRDAGGGQAARLRLLECRTSCELRDLAHRELSRASRQRPFLCGPSEMSLRLCLARAAGESGPFEFTHETWDGITCELRGDSEA